MSLLKSPIQDKRIAIVVPIYNTAQYLEETLNSLVCQTHKNFVAYLVDDGSTDGSAAIIEKYAKTNQNFFTIHKANGGVSSARNLALEKIEKDGHFDAIAFLDSDDKYTPDCLELSLKYLFEKDVDFVIFGFRNFDKTGYESNRFLPSPRIMQNQEEMLNHFFKRNLNPKHKDATIARSLSNKVFKIKLFNNKRFSTNLARTEDQELYIEILKDSSSCYLIDRYFLDVRLRKSSLTHNNINLLFDLDVYLKEYLNNLQNYKKEHQIEIKKSLLNAWWNSAIHIYGNDPSEENKNRLFYVLQIIKSWNKSERGLKRIFLFSLGEAFRSWYFKKRYIRRVKEEEKRQLNYFD